MLLARWFARTPRDLDDLGDLDAMQRDPTLPALAELVRCASRVPVASATRHHDLPDALVRGHGLGPLAARAGVSRFDTDRITSSLMAEVRANNVAEVVDGFAARGIGVILLKGISYAGSVYADPADRPMLDVDLLVPPADHGEAARVLRRLGYWVAGSRQQRSHLHHAVAFKRRGSAIDLHRSIMQPWRSRIDLAGVWRRARPAAERDDGALRMDPVDELVIHLAHVARHELLVPLVNYVDAARLLGRFPRGRKNGHDETLERAEGFRIARGVATALAVTHALCHLRAEAPRARRALMPGVREVLLGQPVPRALQLVRKALLVEGPIELVGLAAAWAYGTVAHRLPR